MSKQKPTVGDQGPRSRRSWVGIHIYFDGAIYGESCDRVLVAIVDPLLASCRLSPSFVRSFFVRYGEGGSHVRVRMYGESDPLREKAIEFLASLGSPLVESRARLLSRDRPAIRADWVHYEPEVTRYGGLWGVSVAERSFADSSELALNVLKSKPAIPRAGRLGQGLLAMLAGVHSFVGEHSDAAHLLHQYADGCLSRVSTSISTDPDGVWALMSDSFERQAVRLQEVTSVAWQRLGSGGRVTVHVDRYYRRMRATVDRLKKLCHAGRLAVPGQVKPTWQQAARYLLPSYLHMTNNRLGISTGEEVYLARLVSRSLFELISSEGRRGD